MKLIFDPSDDARYLACLRACFPGWGDETMYRWCFARAAGALSPERMVFLDETEAWVAGSGISYRRIRTPKGMILVSLMTGSWTLPEARGKGLFAAFIQETRKRAASRGAAVVLAFLGDLQRPSTKKLVDAGSRTVASANAIGDVAAFSEAVGVGAPPIGEAKTVAADDAEELYARCLRARDRATGFDYPDLASFRGQMIERALPTEIVRFERDGVALIERAPDTDRLLLIDEGEGERVEMVRALWTRAARAGRALFAFGLGPAATSTYERAGLRVKPGYLSILPATEEPANVDVADSLATMSWECHSGDRI